MVMPFLVVPKEELVIDSHGDGGKWWLCEFYSNMYNAGSSIDHKGRSSTKT